MRRTLFASLILVFLALPAFSQFRTGYSELEDSDMVRTLRSHVTYLSSPEMEGRAPGSEGEKAAAGYVQSVLESYGIDILSGEEGDIFGISRESGDTLVSRNVAGFVPGYDNSLKDRFLVAAARLDNLGTTTLEVDGTPVTQVYAGANGNASGLAMMLELARMVSTNSILFRRPVLFVAFGASTQGFAGSWYFLNRSLGSKLKIDAMVNLDMLGSGNSGFFAYTSSNPDMNMIVSQVNSDIQPATPSITARESYPSDHRSFYAKEIPSVFFTTGIYPEHGTVRDVADYVEYGPMERELEYIYNFTRYLANVENAPQFRMDKPVVKGDGKLRTYDECDRKPVFLGNQDVRMFLVKWVYQYLKYPKAAVEDGIQGRVTVGFTIRKNGKVTDVRVLRSAHPLLDDEAVRVVAASPDWKPGRINGTPVDVAMSVAVDFTPEQKGKSGIKK